MMANNLVPGRLPAGMPTVFTGLPDAILIERTLAGNTAAFDVLIVRHIDTVRARVRHMLHNSPDVDDVVQTCLFKAWNRLETFRGDSDFRTWLIRVAINEVQQHRRFAIRLQLHWDATDPQTLPSGDEAQDDAMVRQEARSRVRQKVAELPAKYRDAVVVCDLQEATVKEAARGLRTGVPRMKSRLFRARKMLRESLAEAA